jgi:hypothetical protein
MVLFFKKEYFRNKKNHSLPLPGLMPFNFPIALMPIPRRVWRIEAIHVAAAIRGAASLVNGVQMRNIEKSLGVE